MIGRKAEEVAEMAVQHYQLPYTGAQYLEMHQVVTISVSHVIVIPITTPFIAIHVTDIITVTLPQVSCIIGTTVYWYLICYASSFITLI